jgi:tRNA (adenine57-N1/adenine58-N1)-methyltransferase
MSRVFDTGDRALLIDRKARRYLVALSKGGEFHSHAGIVYHDLLIGQPEGISVRSSRGGSYLAIRPTLAEFILTMPRGAQVIYPKDLGPILMRRIGRFVHDVVARRRSGHRLRTAQRLRLTRPTKCA